MADKKDPRKKTETELLVTKPVQRLAIARMQDGDIPALVVNNNNSSATVPWGVVKAPGKAGRTNTLNTTLLPGVNTIPLRVWDGIKKHAVAHENGTERTRGYLAKFHLIPGAEFDVSKKIPQVHKMTIDEAKATIENTAKPEMIKIFRELEENQRHGGPRKGLIEALDKQLKAINWVDKKIEDQEV